MKNLKFYILTAFVALTTAAFAQKDYNTIFVSYSSTFYNFTEEIALGADEESVFNNTDGITISYLHAFNVTKKLPLYVETGLEWNMEFWSHSQSILSLYNINTDITTMRLNVPVNVVYKFQIGDFAIKPYTGLYLKFNLMGEANMSIRDIDGKDVLEQIPGYSKEDTHINFYDKEKMGDEVWNVFQAGWQIGAKFDYRNITIGAGYALDFVKVTPQANTSNFHVGIGYVF